ncbi:phosphotransferase family protein [Cutibacterium sp.]|uniref:phosphotransferase family protein n=1 Tax=Cutibacterium sp. TaxID=1912221 RepID=UPI0026DB56F3|nr:phosphotransferase [Cutibacterium sp.]MDO4411747.1 phosphotransferase [Cutibacterium sp.]
MGLGWIDDAAFVLGTELSFAEVLRDGVRSSVVRCWVDGSTVASRGARTVITKYFRSKAMAHNSGGFGIVREWAGLATIPGAPRLLAADLDLRVIVMADLGQVTTLADVLSGCNPEAAVEAGRAWGRGLGATMRSADAAAFRRLVRKADPRTVTAGGPASPRLPSRGATRLADLMDDGVLSEEASAELGLFVELAGGDEAVLTQADPCPGNIIIPADGSHATFIDFEASSIHHPAVDVAHLQVPWVGCDDSGQVSATFREAAMAGYREAGPEVSTDMIALAAAAATLQTTELSLKPLQRRETSGRFGSGRQRLVSRWRWVADHPGKTPNLARMCGRAADLAVQEWGWPEELETVPCFRR